MSHEHGGGGGGGDYRPIESMRDAFEPVADTSGEIIGLFLFGLFAALGMAEHHQKTGKGGGGGHH